MNTTDTQAAPSPQRRRWLQYRLRTMLAFMVLVAIGMSCVAVPIQEARRQKQVAEALTKAGAFVSTEPIWLGKVLGDDSLVNITSIEMGSTDRRRVDNDWLVQLEGLSQLRVLVLCGTRVSDAGLVHLEGASRLHTLHLGETEVSDAGLVHLEKLSGLVILYLNDTKITDAGLAHLEGLSELRELNLSHTKVTHAGLSHLEGLSELAMLHLDDTKFTHEDVEKVFATLPRVWINWE